MPQDAAFAESRTIEVAKVGARERAALVAAVNRSLADEDSVAKRVAVFKEGVNLTSQLKLAGGRGWFAPMLRDLLKQGVSVVVNDIGVTAPAARAVERTAGVPADWVFQQNLYITPRDVKGFVPHCDPHMVAVAQLHGRKEWFIYDKRLDNPVVLDGRKDVLVADPKEKLEVRQRFVVEPGDMFIIPRGAFHAACALDGGSVHLAIGCAGVRPVDVIWSVASAAMAQSGLRADMTPAAAREAAAAFLAGAALPNLALPRHEQPETDVPEGPVLLSFEEALRVL